MKKSSHINKKLILHISSVLLFLLFQISSVSAQVDAFWGRSTPPVDKVLEEAEAAFAAKDYYSAMKYYEYVLDIKKEPLDLLFKYAQAARHFNAYTFADSSYTKVVARDTTLNYPMAKFYLAKMKKATGQFKMAQELFEEFVAENPKVRNDRIETAKAEAEICEWAQTIADNPNPDLYVNRMEGDVNTPQAEFGAVSIGSTTYYSSLQMEKQLDKKTPPRPFSRIFKVTEDNAPTLVPFNEENKQTAYVSFNKDTTRVYYTICDETGLVEVNCQIYYRPVMGEQYGEPVRLPPFINQEGSTNTQPNIGYEKATDREVLFFVSDRKSNSKGGLDIYKSYIDQDGGFENPQNLTEINTEDNDISPFYHTPTQTLYFSTDGRPSLGGYDFYKAAFLKDEFTGPVHLPAPLNTSYNDSHFYLNEGGTGGYFASNREDALVLEPEYEACCSDLYEFSNGAIDLTAYTFNLADKTELPGVRMQLLRIEEDGSTTLVDEQLNKLGNDFPFPLKKGNVYILKAEKDDFVPLQDTIDLTDPLLTKNRFLEKELYLVPMDIPLNVFTFNKKTKDPLPNVEVRLIKDGEEIDFSKKETEHEHNFNIRRNEKYDVIGTRVGYVSDTASIYIPMDSKELIVNQDLFLRPKEIEEFPPLMIFFDNDQPNPKTRKTTTELTYDDTFKGYMNRKDKFIEEYTKVLEGRDSFVAVKRIEAFFDREVANGYENLKVFCDGLEDVLKKNYQVVLEIKGFTSPRANPDYNEALSQRRADCLNNHILTYKNGVLREYFESGQLSITEIGYGESTAPQFISDKLDDERNSIYSVTASFERKVEIVGIRIEK